jgi:crossover junction endodeoxyribonuclease RuvC
LGRHQIENRKSKIENAVFRVLGIDPGLHITGYGVVRQMGRGFAVEEAGIIRPPVKAEMPERLMCLHGELTELIAQVRPDIVAIEQLYAHYAHPRTAILMGHARGVIMLAATQAGVGVQNLPSTKVKKSLTGNGHASKRQMQLAIQSLCGLDEPPEPPDVADALAIALCAARHAGSPARTK